MYNFFVILQDLFTAENTVVVVYGQRKVPIFKKTNIFMLKLYVENVLVIFSTNLLTQYTFLYPHTISMVEVTMLRREVVKPSFLNVLVFTNHLKLNTFNFLCNKNVHSECK